MAEMESYICDIYLWIVNSKLKLKFNDDNTAFFIIGTSQQLAKVTITSFCVGKAVITHVATAKKLGSWFDSKMMIASHVMKTCIVSFTISTI